jgi:hypothetical protein
MPSAKVLTAFRDKDSRIKYLPNTQYTHDDVTRLAYLADAGYIDFVTEQAEIDVAAPIKKSKKSKG